MPRLSGKIALVTGGNSGMGLESARLMAKEGAQVIITGRRQNELDDAVRSIGNNTIGVQGDVSSLADLDRLMAVIKTKFGRLDVIFANAGHGNFAALGEVTEKQFDSEFATNVKGVFFTVQKALPLLSDGASVILNASIAGYKGFPAFSVYSATKAAVRSFARSWTTDLKARKIRVNALSPGPIDTPIFGKGSLSDEQVEQMKQGFASQVPLGRLGRSEEIANTVVFLASDESSFIAGIDLTVDGGTAQV